MCPHMPHDVTNKPVALFSTLRRQPRNAPRSGWQIGVVFGVLIGLFAFPAVRNILFAQAQFTLIQESTPWLRAMDSRQMRRELPRLDVTAASYPGDYLVQVGRATLAADIYLPPKRTDAEEDRSLTRLAVIAKDFPTATGIYSHLPRNMMRDRVRILSAHSPELPTPYVLRSRDVQLMQWALRRGELSDPENAYWQAMLAVVAFAEGKDTEGLRALRRASGKSRWDAYLYEEILGQWRLYAATYGDRGAMQKIGPLSLLSFPHLRELRNMAEMARDKADEAEAKGDLKTAIRIRQNVWRLGLLMRDTAQWAYEALVGTDIFLIATTDTAAKIPTSSIRQLAQWEKSAAGVVRLLHRAKKGYEIETLKTEAANCGALRERVDVARYDSAYPGIPPGIPLRELFGSWMQGVFLAQQGLSLIVAYGVFWLVKRVPSGFSRLVLRRIAFWSAGAVGGYAAMDLIGGVLTSLRVLMLMMALTIWGLLALRNLPREHTEERLTPDELVSVRWTQGTALRLLCLVFLTGLFALIALRPALTSLHPVALMLTGMLDAAHTVRWETVILQTLYASALPFLLLAALVGWAIYRRVSPIAAIRFGLPRLFLPSLCILLVSYLLVLNQTLRWDAEASRSINIAAQNDLNWVLTHSNIEDTAEE